MDTTPRRRGRPPTGVTPKRNVRIGEEWDQAAEIASADGETMTALVRRLLAEYIRLHGAGR